MSTRAFDLALFVPTPASVGDGVVVASLGPPFTSQFAHVVTSVNSGVTVSASIPAANAQNQILLSGPGPAFAWSLGVQSGGGGGGIPEAPIDGLIYGRQSANWSVVGGTTAVTEAPRDGNGYVRQDGAWTNVIDAGTF